MRTLLIVGAALVLVLSALLAAGCTAPGEVVTREEVGDDWPFMVDEVRLWCQPPQAVMVRADGMTYGLNGAARDRLEMPPPDPIWRDDPTAPAGSRAKVSLAPLIERGLGMCRG